MSATGCTPCVDCKPNDTCPGACAGRFVGSSVTYSTYTKPAEAKENVDTSKIYTETLVAENYDLKQQLTSARLEITSLNMQLAELLEAPHRYLGKYLEAKQQLAAKDAQILAMRCCGNCNHIKLNLRDGVKYCGMPIAGCENLSKWEGK